MAVRKGFVHTLEAVIASTIILGVVINVFPNIVDQDSFRTDNLRETVERIDERDNLSKNTSEIEEQLKSRTSNVYNLSVRQVENKVVVEQSIDGGENFSLEDDRYRDVMLWIDSNAGFSADFRNKTLIDGYTDTGYVHRQISGNGSLNFSGSFQADLSVVEYSTEGSIEGRDDSTFTFNYISNNGTSSREVKVRKWD